MDSLSYFVHKVSITQLHNAFSEMGRGGAYLDDTLHNPINLPGLDHPLGLGPQPRQLRLVALYPPLQIRNIILVEPLPPVKQVPQRDQRVPLPLQVLQHPLVPRPGLVHKQRLALAQVLGHGHQPVVEQGDVVGVGGVRVGVDLRQGVEAQRDARMVRRHALGPLDEPVHQVADGDVQLRAAPDAVPRALEEVVDRGGEGVLEPGREGAAGEFVLHAEVGLLAPDGKFLGD